MIPFQKQISLQWAHHDCSHRWLQLLERSAFCLEIHSECGCGLMIQKHLEVVWKGYYLRCWWCAVISIWGSFPLIEATGVTPGSRFARPSYFGIADYKASGRSEMLQGYQQAFFDPFPMHRRSKMHPNLLIIVIIYHVPIPCGWCCAIPLNLTI